ncbi:MAG: glycerol-3-phosphate 1-O-acyltransferase PlsY [Ignavibacteriales bacterium]|nr:glycerol-3-phosphate 1-O-acyltransferase PlsY [Ignavibacteriales bacterium]
MLSLAVVILLTYLVGSIPTSLIVSKLKGGIDVRKYGSGNAGGTNIIRLFGWKLGVLVIVLDALKGAFAILVVAPLMFDTLPFSNMTPFDDLTVVQMIAGVSAILGHIWSVFASFKGGKGVATTLGILTGLAPVEIAVTVGIFFLVFAISKYISLGSIVGGISFPLVMLVRHNIFHAQLTGYGTLIYVSIGLSLLLVYTHRSNIQRLIAGTEKQLTRIHLNHSHKPAEK